MANGTDTMEKIGKADTTNRLPLLTRIWLWVFGRMFDQVKFYKKNTKTIEKCLSDGAVIHVLQYASYLEYLLLCYSLRKNNLSSLVYPDRNWLVRFCDKVMSVFNKKPLLDRKPGKMIQAGRQYILFLQKKGSFLTVRAEKKIDELQALLEIQKETDIPIYLLPEITIWSRRPVSMIHSIWDVFFGNSLHPGPLRRLIILFRHYKTAFMRTGAPLRLSDWTSDEFALHGKNPIKEIRWRMFRFFSEERMAVSGPMTRPRTWNLESVLNSSAVQKTISEIAEEENRSERDVAIEAAKELDFLAADYKFSFIVMASAIMRRVYNRLFNPLVIDLEGFEMIRGLLKQNQVVFVPSHKSHMDYLTWSYSLFEHGIFPPHIIAGENLAFWPMGYLFRRMGAVFIKRSFRGNRLYATVLKQYLAHMLREGYSQEFFIEGGRSRTGKLLQPKFGMLGIYVDAYLKNPSRDVMFVPISIIYSKLPEEGAYKHELTGGEKTKESTSSLLKVLDIFKFRYGAMHVKVGSPISTKEYFARLDIDPERISDSRRQSFIHELGYNIIYRINEAVTVTPTAAVSLALLCSGKKGVTLDRLTETVEIILDSLRNQNAVLSDVFENSDTIITETIDLLRSDGCIQGHTIGSDVVYTVNDNRRLALDYYKNSILHFFVPYSLVAIALGSLNSSSVKQEELRENVRFVAKFFRLELVYSPDSSFDSVIDEALKYFVARGLLKNDQDSLLVVMEADKRELRFYRQVLSNFLESYWVAATALVHLTDKKMSEKKFLKLIMDEGKKMELIGELDRSEAYSKTNFKNAILYFIRRGVLIKHREFDDTSITVLPQNMTERRKMIKKSKKQTVYLELTDEFNSKEALKKVAEQIYFYLGREH